MRMFHKPFRHLVRAALSATVLGLVSAAPAQAQTVTAVINGGLRVLDPIVNTSVVTSIHALMIYDLLLAEDGSGKIQPQMASWQVSEDGKTYTFALRDGLRWHDGSAVTSADCIASIKRWAEVDTMGQVLATIVSSMDIVDDRKFSVTLKQPSDLILQAFAKTSSRPAFMMPRRMAETPANQPTKENIGSGPFRFVAAEFKPGVSAVYEKNKDYMPRSEPASGSAGGKVVNVDRVELVTMPDNMTAVNALIAGEVDFIEFVPFDLVPMLEKDTRIRVSILNKQGNWTMFRMNFLHPPFNDRRIRQAAMNAVGQKEVLQALIGNEKYYAPCAAVFGCGMPYESEYGRDVVIPANAEKARQLLKEANYDGTPVVIMHPSDNPLGSPQPLVIAQQLRQAGFNVEVQTMDWQTLTTRRGNQKTPKEGGWNLFVTFSAVGDQSDPIRSIFVAAAGTKSWFGWPDVPAMEKLRADFAVAKDEGQRKQLAADIQKVAIDEGVVMPLGMYFFPSAFTTRLTGVMEYSRPLFWNLKKAK